MAPSLKEAAMKNPTLLGDPVSLKAESSSSQPTPNDKPSSTSSQPTGHASKDSSNPQDSYASASAPVVGPAPTESDTSTKQDNQGKGDGEHETLKQKAEKELKKGNATQLGDPVSLKAETSDSEPTDEDRGARGTKRDSKL